MAKGTIKKFLICFIILAIGPLIYNIVKMLSIEINIMPKERSYFGLISAYAYYIGVIIAFISKDHISKKS